MIRRLIALAVLLATCAVEAQVVVPIAVQKKSDGTNTLTGPLSFGPSSAGTVLSGATFTVASGGTFTAAAGSTVNISAITGLSTITAAAATNLTLNGGSSGASVTIGQGSLASVALLPADTGAQGPVTVAAVPSTSSIIGTGGLQVSTQGITGGVFPSVEIIGYGNGFTAQSFIVAARAAGTSASPANAPISSTVGGFRFYGYANGAFRAIGNVSVQTSGTFGNSDFSAVMVIGPSTNVVDANDIVIFGGVNAGYNGSVVVGGQSATNPARIFSVDTGGAISIPAWGTRGAFFSTVGQTVTDNTSATGTVAAAVFNSFGAPTINATNASVVYTDIANLYVGAPLTTGNASATNLWGIWNAGKTRLDGTLSLGGANNNSNGILQITASTSATAGIAFGNDTPQASIYRSAASTLTTPGTWEMSGGSGAVDLHIGSSGLTNGGGYMGSAGTARFFVTAGGFFNGSWTASATSFSGLDLGSTTGGVSVYANTGLTAGNTFSPATTAVFGPTGTTIGSSATPTSGQLGITYTTASSSTTTGAIVDSGGLGVAGAAWIGATTNTIGLSNTGVSTFAPVARSSGAASYFTITAPSDTGITTATESIGVNIQGATRTWVDGTVATQREYYFGAPTYNKTTTSATFTTAATVDISGAPVAGAGVTITNPYALRVESGAGLFANALNVAGTAYTYGALPSGATTAGPAITVPATTYTVTGTNTATEFSANYYATPTFTDASVGTITDAFISFYNGPVAAAGGSLVITRRHSVGILDSTSAASSITGGLVVATALGTTATSVGIGGGNINAGGTITSGGAIAAGTTLTTAAGVTAAAGVWNLGALRTSTALVTSTTQVIQIAVGGTLFSLMTCTTNP